MLALSPQNEFLSLFFQSVFEKLENNLPSTLICDILDVLVETVTCYAKSNVVYVYICVELFIATIIVTCFHFPQYCSQSLTFDSKLRRRKKFSPCSQPYFYSLYPAKTINCPVIRLSTGKSLAPTLSITYESSSNIIYSIAFSNMLNVSFHETRQCSGNDCSLFDHLKTLNMETANHINTTLPFYIDSEIYWHRVTRALNFHSFCCDFATKKINLILSKDLC